MDTSELEAELETLYARKSDVERGIEDMRRDLTHAQMAVDELEDDILSEEQNMCSIEFEIADILNDLEQVNQADPDQENLFDMVTEWDTWVIHIL